VSSGGQASVRPLERPLDDPGDEAVTGTRGEDAPVEGKDPLERVLEPLNLQRARHQVRRHQGAPGSDGMTVEDLEGHLKAHGPTIRAALVEGSYAPQPVRRTEIPKPGGGIRHLGMPMSLAYCLSSPSGLGIVIAEALRLGQIEPVQTVATDRTAHTLPHDVLLRSR
jgi:hypothetical protein